jgi:hypothetical protein
MNRKNFQILFAFGMLLSASGCISYTTLQNAVPIEPGTAVAGVGTSLMIEGDEIGVMPEADVRIGVLPSFDIGGKFVVPSLFFLDGKVALMRSPFTLSADLGWSYFSYSGKSGTSSGVSTGWYPMIIMGQDHWYVAVKRVYLLTSAQFEFFGKQTFNGEGWAMTNLVVGGVIGSKFRLLPEVNFIAPTGGKMFVLPAVGVQYLFD